MLRAMKVIAITVFALVAVSAAQAQADAEAARFKGAITRFLDNISPGIKAGEVTVGTANGKLVASLPSLTFTSLSTSLTVGAVSITKEGEEEGGRLLDLTIEGPDHVQMEIADISGSFSLSHVRGRVLLDAATGRARTSQIDIDGVTGEVPKKRLEIATGAIHSEGNFTRDAEGAWKSTHTSRINQSRVVGNEGEHGSGELELTIDTMDIESESDGPSIEAFNNFLRGWTALMAHKEEPADKRFLYDLIAGLNKTESGIVLTGIRIYQVQNPDRKAITLHELRLGTTLSGLAAQASLRLQYRHDGLEVPESPPGIGGVIPHHLTADFEFTGVELKNLLEVLGQNGDGGKGSEPSVALAGAMFLVAAKARLLMHDLSFDADNTSIHASGEAMLAIGTPHNVAGRGDILVRGIEALASPDLSGSDQFAGNLPIIEALGTREPGTSDNDPLRYLIEVNRAGAVLINGADVSVLLGFKSPPKTAHRTLRPSSARAMEGKDVEEIQTALVAKQLLPHVTGRYDPTTAAAVVRFQRQAKLNADGVINEATRAALLNE